MQREVAQLRIMFEGMEAKEKERQWLKNQQTGDLDDNRLVDGATGERNVYKRRGMRTTLTQFVASCNFTKCL